ncbi:MAG: hypothetical protein J6D21_03120 [Clostridia bacterium]|nr:hypothetical protein [Clostridia bacterium]MBO5261945.1 hypothetical protein [Clostridia bacterium]
MTENNSKTLEEFFYDIITDYVETCQVQQFDSNIIVTYDMKEEYIKLRNDLVENGKRNPDDIQKYNGLTVQPKETNGVFTILLNANYMLENYQNNTIDWVGTLVHEAVHVNDFKDYFQLVNATSYDELYEYNPHAIFLHWTEFHARAIGHYFLRKYTLDDFKNEIHIQHIVDTELPYQTDYLVEQLNGFEDSNSKVYVIMHYLGRLAVWRYLYPHYFNDQYINSMMKNNAWMKDLFNILIQYDSLEKIYPHFDEIEQILIDANI